MAVASPCQDAKTQHCMTTSRSSSLTGAWSSLFSSFSNQHVPVQMPDQMQLTPMSLEADDKPSLTPAAVHQSAVFAALFEDMIASQSCDALLHVQTSPAASNHSSAVSLCDSAASFSFKTAMRNQNATEAAVLSSTLQPHFVAQQPVAAGLPDAGETHLSFTLKDWQTDADCKSACTLTEALLQPATTGKAVAASQAHRSCGPQIFHCQATQGLHSTQQAGFNVTPTPDMKAGSVRDGPRVSHASECVPASAFSSKRARGKSGAAQRQGIKAEKLWRRAPGATLIPGTALEYDSPVTASQTMHMHLNKVAWWLDLQASHNMGQLGSPTPSDPVVSVPADLAACAGLEHDLPAVLHCESGDAAQHTKRLPIAQMSASSSLPKDYLSSGTWQLMGSSQPSKGSNKPSKGISQPMKGSSQPAKGSSQSLLGSDRPEKAAPEVLPAAVPAAKDSCVSAAASRGPSTGTVPPSVAIVPASTALGPELLRRSDCGDASHPKEECSCTPAGEVLRLLSKGAGRLPLGCIVPKSHMPSASTELFLRMEAAAAHEPEEATLGILDSSQPFGMPVWQHASDEQHAALSVQCTSLPLSAQAPVFHIQQQQQQRQQPPEHEEDLYAGLERGADASTGLLPSWHAAVATTTVPQQAEGAPADAVKHDMVGSHAVPIHGPGGTAPEQGFSAKGPEHGSSRYRDPAGAQRDAELREKGKLTPKAAEAPLVKQGSYAVAAKLARLRSKRRQQEIEELIASRRQTQVASGGKQPAVQGAKPTPAARGLLIGSYRHSGPVCAAGADARNVAIANRQPVTAEGPPVPSTLSPLSSRPSTVSANHRYASTLATEASLSYSEPESAAGSAAGSAGLGWEESVSQGAAACVEGGSSSSSSSRRKGVSAVPSNGGVSVVPCQPAVRARLAAGKARALRKKAGLPLHQADSAFPTARGHHSAQLQTHLHAERSSKPPTTPLALKPRHASAEPSKQHAVSPLGKEESRLLASLQRRDCQLTTAHKGSSHFKPQLPQQASSSSVLSPAQHSRLLPTASSQQKPCQSQCVPDQPDQASPPTSTQAFLAGHGAKTASSHFSRGKGSRWSAAQADSQAGTSDRATDRSTVSGSQAKCVAGRRAAAAKLPGGAKTGTPIKAAGVVGTSKPDVSNSAEQQALQQSLAKLDARLTSLTARHAGRQTAQPPASLPGCLSAPITRQSSFWKTPRPHSIIHPLPASHPMAVTPRHPGPMSAAVTLSQVAAAARQQGSPCKLPAVAGPGSRAADRQQTCQAPQGGSAMPDAALMLPDLSHCPSVASAPCTTGACKPRRHPGLHCNSPGVARAALLARSRIPRAARDLPPQQPQQQQQLCRPSGSTSHTASSYSQPFPQGPYQYLSQPSLPMPPGSIEAHQTTVPAAQAASVIAGGISMQLMGDRQYLQPELPQHISRRHQQQQQGSAPRCCQPSATEAQEGLQYEYQQPQLGSIHHHQVWQQQQLPMHPLGRQLQHQQPPLQPLCHDWWHGQSMPAARAAAPLVQHAWYAALPGAYQPPGANPCIPRECTQHDHQQPHLDSPASGAHAMSHTAMSQYGMPYAAELHWAGRDGHSSAPDAAEAAHSDNDCSTTCSPNVLSTQVQQQQQQRMNSKQELCALSPSPKVPKGVIKTYNLKALLS